MWAYESVFYQIYPLGFVGAPFENDGVETHRILKVLDWTDHIKKLGANAIYFSPVFESDTHGYNTRDYRKIDCRLGSNEDFKQVCDKLHSEGIRVVLDGVFNHAGRGFWAFQDVLKNRENSPYLNWFHINLGGNSNYNDGLWYEGWEGNYDLVKLNLQNEEVVQYLLESVRGWVDEFDIDGLISGAYFNGFGDISDGRENERSSVSPRVEFIFSVNIGDSTHISLFLVVNRDIHQWLVGNRISDYPFNLLRKSIGSYQYE